MTQIKINGNYMAYVRPGKGFKEALLSPLELKPFVMNESRLEHGTRVLVENPRFAMRSITLEFQIVADTVSDFEQTKRNLFLALYNGSVSIQVPEWSDEVFHLVYTGKSPSYDSGLSGRACKVKVGFDEPDPSNRE